MIERTGNCIVNPDHVFNPDGTRKRHPDGSPVFADPINPQNVIEDLPMLGRRTGRARRFGAIFYQEQDAAAAEAGSEPATAVPPADDPDGLYPYETTPFELKTQINELAQQAHRGDAKAERTLAAIAAEEYGRTEIRRDVRGVLSRHGIRKPVPVEAPEPGA